MVCSLLLHICKAASFPASLPLRANRVLFIGGRQTAKNSMKDTQMRGYAPKDGITLQTVSRGNWDSVLFLQIQ